VDHTLARVLISLSSPHPGDFGNLWLQRYFADATLRNAAWLTPAHAKFSNPSELAALFVAAAFHVQRLAFHL
jgi:hypothetical protein